MNKSINFLTKNINVNLILSLIIPLLIWGPFFPDLIVSVSVILFIYIIFKKKDFKYLNNKVFLFFLFFCIVSILCSLLADDVANSIKSSLFYFRIGVFSCLIWYLIDRDKSILNYFYYSLIVCFSSLVIDGYFQFFFGYNIVGFPSSGARISSFFNDELIMGSYLSRLFPLLFALFLIKKKQKYEIYYIGFLFILVDVLIYISGERTAFFFLNLSTVFIIILIKKYQKFRFVTLFISIVLVSILTFSSDKISERMIKSPVESMGLLKDSQTKNIFTPNHDSLIKTAYNMFLDKPLIGHGPKSFRLICKNEKYQVGILPCSTHPHNFYIQLLAETGIIGFLFLLIALSYVIYTASRQLKTIMFRQKRFLSDYQVCLLAGILITVWPFSPNGNFFNNWLMIVYSLPVGFYLQSVFTKKKD